MKNKFNKSQEPSLKTEVPMPKGVSEKRFDHPSYNYLGHFKQPKFIKQGHNDSGDMASVGLDHDEARKFEKGFNQALGMKPYSADGAEDAPAPRTVGSHESERGRMGGMSNQPYSTKTRITYK